MNQTIKTRIEQIGRGEVPEGYKKTKVGIVPCDWGESKLKDISTHVTKKNIDNHIHLTFTNSATQGVIKQTDYFDKEIANQENTSGYYIVEKNDYIYNPRISVSAPCGPINQSHFDEIGIVSPLYTVFKMKKGYEENRYFEFYFKSTHWYKYMHSVANYGARHDRMNITNDDLFGMPIPFPSIEEQERIAEILGTQDKLIALKEKRIAEKKQQKKYLMQQLLIGTKRLPGFTGEWGKVKLGACISEVNERSKGNGGYDILSVTKDGIVFQSEHFNKQIASEDTTGYKILKKGQLAFSSMNLWLGSLDVLDLCEEGIISPAYKVFAFDDALMLPEFGKYFLKTHKMIWLYKSNSEQGASVVRRNLDLESVLSTTIEIPIIIEQREIVSILSKADKEIELLQKDLEEEKNKKKALMQLLLTGIVRVS